MINLRRCQGISLIEVLISLVVFAVGFLALSSLQNRALQNNRSAYAASQATILAQSMLDKIRANPAASGVDYQVEKGSELEEPTKLCNLSDCTPQEIANIDKFRWLSAIRELLPSGDGLTDIVTIKAENASVPSVPDAEFDRLVLRRVTVQWAEQSDAGTQTKSITLESL